MLSFLRNNRLELIAGIALLAAMVVVLWQENNDLLWQLIVVLAGVIGLSFVVNKMIALIWLIIFMAPISLGTQLPFLDLRVSFPTELFTGITLLVFAVKKVGGLSIDTRIFRHPLSILLLFDFIWAFICATQSELSQIAFKRVMMKGVFLSGYFFLFGLFLDNPKRKRMLYFLYALGAIYPIYHAFTVHARSNFVQASSFNISQPFFSDHTIYGACLAFLLPFFLLIRKEENIRNDQLKKMGIWFMIVLLCVAIFLSYSRASWISLMVALLFYVGTKLRMKLGHILFFLITATAVISYNFEGIYQQLQENETKYADDAATHLTSVTNLQSDASNLERINRWVCAYRMFEDQPVFGFGPGTYQFVYDEYQTTEFMTRISTHKGNRGNAHSEYMTYLSEEGLPGLVLFLVIVFYTIHLAISLLNSPLSKEQRRLVYAAILGLITFFSHGLFNTFSDYEKMSILVLGSLGILVNIDIQRRANQRESTQENRKVLT